MTIVILRCSVIAIVAVLIANPFIKIINALQIPSPNTSSTRRNVLTSIPSTILTSSILSTTTTATINVQDANAADSLAAKLTKRDASVLKNSVFNIPPSAQIYPPFMRGQWDVSLRFAGYLFPSQTITKDKIVSNVSIPGFQKCSIASIADVGRDLTTYRMNISQDTGLEDRVRSLTTSIGAHLGYNDAVDSISYDSQSNPNRITINFQQYRTRNAERIELFCNARESEIVPNPTDSSVSIFVCSEYIRQVTFSLSQEFGVARQVNGNYAHFWTWREQPDGKSITGNVLTACYLDPQDSMFFQEPSKPVAVYSHQVNAVRV